MVLLFLSWYPKETKDSGNENQKKPNLKQGSLLRDSNKVEIEDDILEVTGFLVNRFTKTSFSFLNLWMAWKLTQISHQSENYLVNYIIPYGFPKERETQESHIPIRSSVSKLKGEEWVWLCVCW